MVYQWQRLWLKMDLSEKDWGARVDFKLTLGPPMCVGSVDMLKNIWNSPRRGSLPLKCIPSHGLMPSQDMVQILLPSHGFKGVTPSKTRVFDSLGILIIQTWIPSHGFKGVTPLKTRVFDSLAILIIQKWIPSHGFGGVTPFKTRVFDRFGYESSKIEYPLMVLGEWPPSPVFSGKL